MCYSITVLFHCTGWTSTYMNAFVLVASCAYPILLATWHTNIRTSTTYTTTQWYATTSTTYSHSIALHWSISNIVVMPLCRCSFCHHQCTVCDEATTDVTTGSNSVVMRNHEINTSDATVSYSRRERITNDKVWCALTCAQLYMRWRNVGHGH